MKRVAFVLAGIVTAAAGQMRVKPMPDLVGPVDAPNLSPDGKTLAFTWSGTDYGYPKLHTLPVGGSEPVPLTNDPPFLKDGCGARSPSWSPDGRRLAYAVTCMNGESAVYIRDLAAGKDREVGECVETEFLISWSADGGFAIAAVDQSDLTGWLRAGHRIDGREHQEAGSASAETEGLPDSMELQDAQDFARWQPRSVY